MEEKHVSENRIVSIPGTYSIFGTKENTKPPEINALPLDSVIGDFIVIAVNEHPSAYTVITLAPVLDLRQFSFSRGLSSVKRAGFEAWLLNNILGVRHTVAEFDALLKEFER